MNCHVLDVDNVVDEPWSFNQTTPLPKSVPLPSAIVAYKVLVTLAKTDMQQSPYFELRGCIFEGLFLAKL